MSKHAEQFSICRAVGVGFQLSLLCSHSQPVRTWTSQIQGFESNLIDGVAGIFSVMPRDSGRLEIRGRNCIHNDDPLVCLDHPAVPSHRDCCQHVVTLQRILKNQKEGSKIITDYINTPTTGALKVEAALLPPDLTPKELQHDTSQERRVFFYLSPSECGC